jgi:hypothetical protein
LVVAVDVDLGEHREVDVERRGDEFENLLVGARFLFGELVARNAEDDQVVVVVVERTQTCVLRRETSTARDVDDQGELALVVGEVDLVTRDRGHRDVVESHERRP